MASTPAKASPSKKPLIRLNMGIRTFVFSLMLVGSLVPIALNSWFSYSETRSRILLSSDRDLIKQGQETSGKISSWLDSNSRVVEALSVASDMSEMNPEMAHTYLQRIQKKYPWFYSFWLADAAGQQITRSDDGTLNQISDRQYFKKAVAGEPVSYQFGISKGTNKPAILLGAPIRKANSSEVLGVIAGGANMDSLAEKITSGRLGRTGFSYLISTEGVILSHPKTELIGAQLSDKSAIINLGKVIDTRSPEGNPIKVVALPSGSQLFVIAQIDQEEVDAPIKEAQKNAIGLLALAIALAAFLSYSFGKTLSDQINKLSVLADQLSKAQSGAEIKDIEQNIKDIGGTREVSSLAQSIQRLANSIKLALDALS